MRYLAALLFLSVGSAEVIDRIAVTVDKGVIAESEVLRQIRITAFLNDEPPDFSRENRRATADRLVEQLLIRRELESSGYVAPPSTPADKDQPVLPRFKTPDDYKLALAKYQLTDEDVRKALAWQVTLLDFVEMRFRPGIQIPPSEMQEYYDQQAAQNPGKMPTFEEAKADIENILTAQRIDSALDRWLGQARTQSRIRYMQEVFR